MVGMSKGNMLNQPAASNRQLANSSLSQKRSSDWFVSVIVCIAELTSGVAEFGNEADKTFLPSASVSSLGL